MNLDNSFARLLQAQHLEYRSPCDWPLWTLTRSSGEGDGLTKASKSAVTTNSAH